MVVDRIRARYCLIAIVVTLYLQPGVGFLVSIFSPSEWYWESLIVSYYAQLSMALFILVVAHLWDVDAAKLLGRLPRYADLKRIVAFDVFLYCLASVLITATYVPASYLFPDLITWWLEWMYYPSVYLASDGSFPVIANALGFVSLVVFAPVFEEVLFRGYLLHRWSKRWGLRGGILASSLIFGALHADPIEAATFGVGMSLLYLRTQSLFVPMIAHAIYNLYIWLWELYGVLSEGLEYYEYTLEQFRDSWEWGAASAIVLLVMIDFYVRRGTAHIGPLRLPAI